MNEDLDAKHAEQLLSEDLLKQTVHVIIENVGYDDETFVAACDSHETAISYVKLKNKRGSYSIKAVQVIKDVEPLRIETVMGKLSHGEVLDIKRWIAEGRI